MTVCKALNYYVVMRVNFGNDIDPVKHFRATGFGKSLKNKSLARFVKKMNRLETDTH